MAAAGVETDLRPALKETTVTIAPEPALVETLVHRWGTEATSEEATEAVSRAPRPSEPPLPSQAVALAWLPTLKERVGSTEEETVTWSELVMTTAPEPESSVQVMMYTPGVAGFVREAPEAVTVPEQFVTVAVSVWAVWPKFD